MQGLHQRIWLGYGGLASVFLGAHLRAPTVARNIQLFAFKHGEIQEHLGPLADPGGPKVGQVEDGRVCAVPVGRRCGSLKGDREFQASGSGAMNEIQHR